MAWVYIAEELDGTPISELPGAYDKTVVPEPINTFATAGFKVPLDHADADFLLGGDALIRIDETDVPGAAAPVTRFHGRVITAEEVAGVNGHSVAVTAADGFWTLLRRLIGKSAAGYRLGQPSPATEGLARIIQELVYAANLESASGVLLGETASSTSSFVEWYFQSIGEKIAELCATLDGPDWRIRARPDVKPAGSRLPAPTGLTVVPHDGTGPGGSGPYPYGAAVGFAVTAFDENGVESQPSATVNATANVTVGQLHYFTISWTPVPGAAFYKIYRRTLTGADSMADHRAPVWRRWDPAQWAIPGNGEGLTYDGGFGWSLGDQPNPPAGYIGAGGFYCELEVLPFNPSNPILATLSGGIKLDTAFEYGDGLLNVAGYQRAVSLDGTANRAFHLPQGFPDNATSAPLSVEDAASQAARGLLETVVTGDLTADALRTALLQHHIAVRKDPRQVIEFTPVSGVGERGQRYGVDYQAGDVVPFRASVRKAGVLTKRIDALVRIYQVAMSIDANGAATPTLTVTPT